MKCLLLSFAATLLFHFASAQTIILDRAAEKEISTGFYIRFDTSGTLQSSIILQPGALGFRPMQIGSSPQQYGTWWLHFFLKNETAFDREWVLDFQNWSYVTAYIKDSGRLNVHKTGHLLPYAQRDYKVANKAYLLLPIRAGAVKECFIRLQSVYNNDLIPDKLGFRITPRAQIDAQNNVAGKIIFAFLAVFVIMFLYNFFLYLSTRLRSYAIYLVIIGFGFYHTAYNSGYLISFFGGMASFPVLLTYFEKFSSILLGATLVIFTGEFLKTKERYPWWHRLLRAILWWYAATALALIINEQWGFVLSIPAGLITIFTIITLAVKSVRDHYPAAVYFLIGYSAFCLSGIIIILCYTGVLPMHGAAFTYSVPTGSTIEMAFFSFALGNMINRLRSENEESRQKQIRLMQEKEEMRSVFQQELLKTQLETQEETLGQVSEELHDNICQLLGTAKIFINLTEQALPQTPDTLRTADESLSKALQDLRMLTKSLNKEWLSQFNIVQNLTAEVERLNAAQTIHLQLSSPDVPLALSAEFQVILFRIIQESIQNIIKHAAARHVQISIAQNENIQVSITDDGKGFDPTQQTHNGIGIMNMKHRTALLGGTIRWQSRAQQGTEVYIEIPVQQ